MKTNQASVRASLRDCGLNAALAEKALKAVVSTIENTGGIIRRNDDFSGGPVADPEWLDLGDAYRAACVALRIKPKYGRREW